jgi:hypothetical protein
LLIQSKSRKAQRTLKIKFLNFLLAMLILEILISLGRSYASSSPAGWDKTLPMAIYDHSTCTAVQNSDGSYAYATSGFHFCKIDSSGNIEWDRYYGEGWSTDKISLVQTRNGDYLIGGLSSSYAPNAQFLLEKISSSGEWEWEKSFPQINCGSALVIVTNDGGFALAGAKESNDSSRAIVFIKTDSSGTLQWQKSYLNGCSANPQGLVKTSNDGYLVVGTVSSGSSIVSSILALDSFGNQLWNKTYTQNGNSYVYSVTQTGDGGFILAGKTDIDDAPSGLTYPYDAWLFHVDALGNELWSRTYSQSTMGTVANSVVNAGDGSYVFAGFAETSRNTFYSGHETDFCLVKVDQSGELQWGKTYIGHRRNFALSLSQTSDGGYVIAGTSDDFGNEGSYSATLVKTDPQGEPSFTTLTLSSPPNPTNSPKSSPSVTPSPLKTPNETAEGSPSPSPEVPELSTAVVLLLMTVFLATTIYVIGRRSVEALPGSGHLS